MTDFEKREFERQKQHAEAQMHDMYYGTREDRTPDGLKMPPFLSRKDGRQEQHAAPNAAPQQPGNGGRPHTQAPQQQNSKQQAPQQQKPQPKADGLLGNGLNLLNMLNFKGLKMDNDRLVILGLCLLLSSEEVDELLLLALMYIMM